jgi:hypothetical protein
MGEDEKETLLFTRMIISSVSITGSLFIIITYMLFKDLREFTFKLILMLSIADLLFTVSLILPNTGASCYL